MSGNLSHSMRNNYDTHGVSGYYEKVAESYRNPHFGGLKKVLNEFMDRYVTQEKPTTIRILDLAAGSGEATEAFLNWKATRWPSSAAPPAPSPPPAPSTEPSPTASSSSALPPPRQPVARPVVRPVVRPNRPSAFAAVPPPTLTITAADPFTSPAYLARTGLPCLELSFADVAAGKLPPPPPPSSAAEGTPGTAEPEPYDIVIISFALHLVETTSELWALLTELSKRAKWLIVTAPHKKPDVKPSWGWSRWDPSPKVWGPAEGRGNVGGAGGDGFEIVLDRVRLRVWRSEEHWSAYE
ncbi:hypothetical protein BCR35DRAFT_349223 [Leucosporidium creatinivorum]|uniref:Methyltransferase domain-containing protein n=1 Tax=Leucosporidium creatinivorum TaxID=106004 RepID=A0A1Y2G4R5_9BASI|nr:hypothetical protein BCR35DRAFT_349223 [Leucosporidium creatinivorum]